MRFTCCGKQQLRGKRHTREQMKGPRTLRGIVVSLFLLALVVGHGHAIRGVHGHGRYHGRSSKSAMPPYSLSAVPPTLLSQTTTFNVLRFGAAGDGRTNDTQAFQDAWSAACAVKASTVVVPANLKYLIGPVSFCGDSCQPNIVFQIDGAIVSSITRSEARGSEQVSQWLDFKNVKSLTIRGSGTIDGRGSNWWRLIAESDDDQTERGRPNALTLNRCPNVTITGITIQNSPKFHLIFDACHGVEAHGITIASRSDSPNTDGIHLQRSVGVHIHHNTIACGDDCISIQNGTSNVFIHDVKCGPSHGISIGGLGKNNTWAVVSNVTVQDVDITQSMTGVRIKTWQGGSGYAKNIRFANIRVSEVKSPIVIDQFYCDHKTCKNQTAAVVLSNIMYSGVSGTYTVSSMSLVCSNSTTCSNVHLKNVKLSPMREKDNLKGPFCWNTYLHVEPPLQPPVECQMHGNRIK